MTLRAHRAGLVSAGRLSRRGWMRWAAGLLGAGALVVALVVMLAGSGDASAHAPGRGAPVTQAPLSARAAAAARFSPVRAMAELNRIRTEVHVPRLAAEPCLEHVAARTAAAFAAGQNPARAAAGCAWSGWGWVAGTDASGRQMVTAALGRGPAGPSVLVGRAAHHVGFAVGPRRAGGVLTGYVLVWVISQ